MLMLLKRALIAALVLFALTLPAAAQWQVANHALPLGKGAGLGFNAIAPAANTKLLVGGGTSADPVFATMSGDCGLVAGVVTCTKANGVSMPSSGTSGGVPYYSSSSAISSSGAFTANAIVLGGGAGVAPSVLGSLGTATTLLHGNASGAPTFAAVSSSDLSITTTSCTNQFVSAISAGGVGTCTTDTLAGAQHANQGTSTTLLHGNGAGNPSWAAVVSADLNITTTTCTNQFLSAISATATGTCTTDTLAGAQHANQGTTTTVLHGNGSGNPSWGQVAIGSDVSGLGTGVATALGTNVGSAGAPVVNGGALGTPSSGTATNLTGTASGLTAGNVTTNANLTGPITSVGNATSIASQTGTGTKFVMDTSPAITGTLDVQQAVKWSGDISPTQIAANTNDYAPTGFSTATTLRLSTDASRNVTGLAGGAGGRVIIIHNVGSNPLVLTNQDTNSTAANRFLFGGDMTLAADTSVTIKYDTTSSRWRAITSPGSGGGGGGGVTSVGIAAGTGLATSGTCTITTSGTCTVSIADQFRQNQLLICAGQAKSLAAYQRILETFCDGYKASDGVNSGSSTNYSVNTSPGYAGPSTPAQQGSARASATPISNGFTMVDRSYSLGNSQKVVSIGVDLVVSGTVVVKVIQRNSAGNYTVVYSQSVSHPGTGFVDFTLTSPYTIPSSGTFYIAEFYSGNLGARTSSSNARAFLSGDQTGTASGYTEDSSEIAPTRVNYGPANMTLITTTQTADASASNGLVLMEIDPIDSITLNTDLTAEVTCDGGTHWAAATLSSIGKGQSGRTVVESADTACTAGTSFAARIKTLNNKNVNVYKLTQTVH